VSDDAAPSRFNGRGLIAFDGNVECESSFDIGILPNKKIGQRLARS
jgi:hypothetical protein